MKSKKDLTIEELEERLKKDNELMAYNGKTKSCSFMYDLVIKFKHGQALKKRFHQRECDRLLSDFRWYLDDEENHKGSKYCEIRAFGGTMVTIPLKKIQHIEHDKAFDEESFIYCNHWKEDYSE